MPLELSVFVPLYDSQTPSPRSFMPRLEDRGIVLQGIPRDLYGDLLENSVRLGRLQDIAITEGEEDMHVQFRKERCGPTPRAPQKFLDFCTSNIH